MSSRDQTPVEAAINQLGGPTKAAEALGVAPAVVGMWKLRKRVPAERVLDLETLSGISRHELRPDIFGPREGAAA